MAAEMHGWLLHRFSQGDSNLVAQFFTLEVGRIDLLARGGRKNPLLQPFQPLWLTSGGRGKLPGLRRLEATAAAQPLAGKALWCGFYINELLTRLLALNQPSVALFACYGETLAALGRDEDPRPALRHFEQRLLADCGYGLDLQHDCFGQPLKSDCCYRLEDAGLTPAAEGFEGSLLIDFAAGTWTPQIARTSRDLLRIAIDRQLGGYQLKSRAWFRQITPK